MYTIKRAAQQVGISAATLRAWERRYGIVSPSRTDGGYRLYDDDDVAALTLMARLVDDGWTASLAAGEARQRLQGGSSPADRTPADAGPGSPDLQQSLVAAAAALDVHRLGIALDQMFASGSYEVVADVHLLPAMAALGDAWAAGRVGVAGEHLASHAVMRRLSAAFEAAASADAGPRVLVGMPPGARHEVGLLAFAVAARRRGLAVDYLGADLPVDDWVTAVADRAPVAVVLAVPTAADVEKAREVVDAVRAAHPGLILAVGGREQDRAPARAVRLGHGVGAAARALARLVTPAAAGAATRTDRRG